MDSNMNDQLTGAFRTYCKNYIADGRFPQPELAVNTDDWSALYHQYNTSLCENVTDVLERYMRRFLKNGVRQYGRQCTSLRGHLRSIISDCVDNDLMKCLPG